MKSIRLLALLGCTALAAPSFAQTFTDNWWFTDLNTGHMGDGTQSRMIPDFVKMADAYGALGIRVTKVEEIDAAIKLALETNDRPVVIDFIVSRDAVVWPMVPQGVGNSSVQYAREHAPQWEEE